MQAPEILLPHWDVPARVNAAFSLRSGGVSDSPFDSLNLGIHVGDDPLRVAENRRRLRAALQLPAEPLWLDQVHGADVLGADAPGVAPRAADGRPRADAVVTHRAGVVCCIQVADCLPVLLAARDGSAIGAAHAGWRGLAAGVIENTVRAMRVPAAGLVAWLGPAIGPEKFEVGEDVREAFVARGPRAAAQFRPNERGRWLCDLPALARAQLAALGVVSVSGGQWCTMSDAERFFSHRRDGRSGRMAALLWLSP
jgi:hypothetical protein